MKIIYHVMKFSQMILMEVLVKRKLNQVFWHNLRWCRLPNLKLSQASFQASKVSLEAIKIQHLPNKLQWWWLKRLQDVEHLEEEVVALVVWVSLQHFYKHHLKIWPSKAWKNKVQTFTNKKLILMCSKLN
jgi:hypothetical protein